MAKVNIMSIRQTPSLAPGRIGLTDSLVTFQVEGQGSDFIVIPDPNPDPKRVQADIAAQVAGRHASEGSTFEV